MATKRPKLDVVRVTYRKALGRWVVILPDGEQLFYATQWEALRAGRAFGRARAANIAGGDDLPGVTLRWQRKRDRTWVDEGTYPRSRDPRRSKG